MGRYYVPEGTLSGTMAQNASSSSSLAISATELQRARDRLLQGVIRGACIGLTLRGGLHLVGSLLAAVSKRKNRPVTATAALNDTLRFAAFLGALAGIYIGVDEGIAATVGKDRSAKWRSLVAGMCAGNALLLTGKKNRHHSLATYILLRGITLLVRAGNTPRSKARHPYVHAALAPTRLAHGDTMLMCAACSQIVYAFIMMPQTLPAAYVRFIRKQGAKELYVWQGIRELAERTASGKAIGPLHSLIGTPHVHSHAPVPCHFFHPGQTCSGHVVTLMGPAYKRALSVYLPVYLLPALLVHRQQLLKQPLPILQKLLMGISRSSLFLSAYICLAFGGACAGHAVHGRSTGSIIASSVWIGGLATLLEKKSRRMELALYVLSRSLESFSRCCLEWGCLSSRYLPPRLDILLFAAGCGAITHCYSGHNGLYREVFKSKYLNVLDFVFGNTGFTEGRIKHHPSNQDLLKSVGVRVVRSFSYGSLNSAASMGRRAVSYNSLETAAMVQPLSPVAERSFAAPRPSSDFSISPTAAAQQSFASSTSRRSISLPDAAATSSLAGMATDAAGAAAAKQAESSSNDETVQAVSVSAGLDMHEVQLQSSGSSTEATTGSSGVGAAAEGTVAEGATAVIEAAAEVPEMLAEAEAAALQ